MNQGWSSYSTISGSTPSGDRPEKRTKSGDLGGTMRLGAYPAALNRGSRVSEVYGGATEISERHRHRYEVNTAYKDCLLYTSDAADE